MEHAAVFNEDIDDGVKVDNDKVNFLAEENINNDVATFSAGVCQVEDSLLGVGVNSSFSAVGPDVPSPVFVVEREQHSEIGLPSEPVWESSNGLHDVQLLSDRNNPGLMSQPGLFGDVLVTPVEHNVESSVQSVRSNSGRKKGAKRKIYNLDLCLKPCLALAKRKSSSKRTKKSLSKKNSLSLPPIDESVGFSSVPAVPVDLASKNLPTPIDEAAETVEIGKALSILFKENDEEIVATLKDCEDRDKVVS